MKQHKIQTQGDLLFLSGLTHFAGKKSVDSLGLKAAKSVVTEQGKQTGRRYAAGEN